jgi:hypothetical protein
MVGRNVAVLSKHGTTARDVSAYLSRAGARAHVAVEPTRIQPDVDAVVFFPDDFARSDAHRVWRDLVSRLSRAALVVVTEDAGTYAAVGPRVAVLGRPAWGWMLIDAMRSCWSEIAEETP